MLARLRYHTLRYKDAFWYGGGTLFIFMGIMLFSYPNDDETVRQFLGIVGELGLLEALSIDLNAPGFVLWITLFAGTYLFIIIAITAIRIGARIVPTEDKDGMELLLGAQPKSSRIILFENWISAHIALAIIILPTTLIVVIFAVIYGSTDIIGRFILMFVFLFVVASFFMNFSMFCSILTFSRTWGVRGGIFYFVYSLILSLTAQLLNPIIADNTGDLGFTIDVAVININDALNPAGGLLHNDWNWLELGIAVLLIMIFFGISLWRIKRHDFSEKIKISKNRLGFLPSLDPNSNVAKKYPLIFEQFMRDKNFLIIWTLVMFILFPYEIVLFDVIYGDNPEDYAELINGFTGGFFGVLLGGYAIPGSYVGFSYTQFYALSWLYYGAFVIIISINIPGREVNTETQDLLYGNSVTQRDVIFSRIIAMVLETLILVLTAMISNIIFGDIFGVERDLLNEIIVFMFSLFYLTAVGVFIIAICLLPKISASKKIGFWFAIGSFLIFTIGKLVSSLEFLKYLSFINYLDTGAIIIDNEGILVPLLTVIVAWIISSLALFLTLGKYEHKDMI